MKTVAQKMLTILFKVIAWLLVVFTVFMMIFTIFTVMTVDRNDQNLFGIKFYIVQTDSMSLSDNNHYLKVHFSAGDIIIIRDAEDTTAFRPGDIIAFVSTKSDSYGETITHMIREVKIVDGKLLGYVTYGTNTGTNDEALVEPEYILGAYEGKLPYVGHFFAYVKSTPGYIVCVLVPFLLLILYNGVNVIRLFRQYKREQTEAMETERAQIAAEKKEAENMLRELQALKEQLAAQGISASSNEAPKDNTTAKEENSEEEKS